MNVILGSSSPRRRQILSLLCPVFSRAVPDIDETPLPGENPAQYCVRISQEKARSLAPSLPPNSLLITADTIVTLDDHILGKPSSREKAFSMISSLSNRTHSVLSCITIVHTGSTITPETLSTMVVTDVRLKNLSDSAINQYLDKAHYRDKAGAYAIQEHGAELVSSITGSYTNVVGFPLIAFLTILKDMNLSESFFEIE